MPSIVFMIDPSTTFVWMRRPDGEEIQQVNANPDVIYWVRKGATIFQGKNADGLASVLGELGEIERQELLQSVEKLAGLAQMEEFEQPILLHISRVGLKYSLTGDERFVDPDKMVDFDELVSQLHRKPRY